MQNNKAFNCLDAFDVNDQLIRALCTTQCVQYAANVNPMPKLHATMKGVTAQVIQFVAVDGTIQDIAEWLHGTAKYPQCFMSNFLSPKSINWIG